MFPTVREVAQNVAQFVNKSWPNDRHELYRILTLAQEEIWKSGFFKNSTKWAHCAVRPDGTIVTPHGYNILVGAKIGCRTIADLRDQYFSFDPNGPVNEPAEDRNMSKVIQHMGDYPTLLNFTNDSRQCHEPFNMGVISEGSPMFGSPPHTVISGFNACNKKIYTYGSTNNYALADDESVEQISNYATYGEDFYTETDILEGLQMPITSRMNVRSDVRFSSIYNIAKDCTLSEVSYYAVYPNSKGILIAELGPFQTISVYKTYKILNSCIHNGQAYCLFKMSRPDPIVSDNQFFISADQATQINIAKFVYHSYWKNDIERAAIFHGAAMSDLARSVSTEEPANSESIVIINHSNDQRKKRKFG